MPRVRAAHLVLAGAALQVAFSAYSWATGTAEERATLAGGWKVALLVAVPILLGAPAILLWRPEARRRHAVGRWACLLLGWLGVLSIFWALQGLVLVAAFIWATWRETGKPLAKPAPIA